MYKTTSKRKKQAKNKQNPKRAIYIDAGSVTPVVQKPGIGVAAGLLDQGVP